MKTWSFTKKHIISGVDKKKTVKIEATRHLVCELLTMKNEKKIQKK
jgi:hypothetical protein